MLPRYGINRARSPICIAICGCDWERQYSYRARDGGTRPDFSRNIHKSRVVLHFMKLVLFIQRNYFFIEYQEALYRLSGDEDVNLAVGMLPLRVVDQFDMIEQTPQKGRATLTTELDGATRLMLIEANDAVVTEQLLDLSTDNMASVHWLTKRFKDGWVGTNVKLEVSDASEVIDGMYICLFANGSKGKELSIVNEQTGHITKKYLERNTENTVEIVDAPFSGLHTLTISCDAEPQISGDVRELGFVLVEEIVTAA